MYKIALKKCSAWNPFVLFLAVGFIGFCLNMSILTFALWQEVNVKIALILGITASTTLMFILDRHFVFSYARHKNATPQLVGFVLVCWLGATLNYYSVMGLLSIFPWLMVQIAEVVGLIVGAISNYFFLRYLVFTS